MTMLPSNPMRLLGIVIANGFSSESNVFANLLSARNYEARVLNQEGPGAVAFAAAARVDQNAIDFGWRPSSGKPRSLIEKATSYAKLRRVCRSILPDARAYAPTVIYSSQQKWDCFVASWLARELNAPHVIHLHYIIGPWLGRGVLARLKQAHGVICVSHFIRAQAIAHGVHPWRATTVHNSIAERPAIDRADARRQLGIPGDVPLFSHVGRLDPGKGQLDTIEAFAGVVSELKNARLLIAGEGRVRGEIEARVRGLCLERHVDVLGQRSDVPVILAASDVFVHPSRQDPCPMALLEAAAAGVPAIAYAEGGATEIIRDGVTGRLVTPGDIGGLTAAMLELGLGRDRTLSEAIGSAARECQRQWFSPGAASASFATAIRRACVREHRPRAFEWAAVS